MSDERPLDGRGKKKEQESRRDEPRQSDEVMIQEIIFEGKGGVESVKNGVRERCRIRRREEQDYLLLPKVEQVQSGC